MLVSLHNLALSIGQLLMVEVNNEILIGKLKFIEPHGKMIELEDVRDIKSNYTYSSSQFLALPQIKAIKVIQNDEEVSSLGTTSSFASSSGSNSSTTVGSDSCPSVNLNSSELQRLQLQLDSVVYIGQSDHIYHKAMADLKSQTVVALVIDPLECHRHCRTSLIAVATQHTVYIFDMLALGRILRDFRMLLESERPRKVVHHSPYLVDHLVQRHDVHLAGIFDTFVAYCYITSTRKPLSLVKTVQQTFNIADIYFEDDLQQKQQPADPYQRPLPHAQRQLVAKRAIFQLKLYEYLLHDCMLATFYRQCSNFSKTFSQNEDVVDVAMKLHPDSNAGLEHIEHTDELRAALEVRFEEAGKRC